MTFRKLDLPLSSGRTEKGSGVNYRGEAVMVFQTEKTGIFQNVNTYTMTIYVPYSELFTFELSLYGVLEGAN